jgi:hypothetical protein
LSSPDYAARDEPGTVAFYVPLWKRNGISLDLFDGYWKDVHGPVCARLPGQFQYWQFHVAHNESGLWPEIEGVSLRSSDDEQFDGIAELTFKSTADRETWFRASTILMADEHNIFSKGIGYVTAEGHSRTYLDRIEVGNPNGGLGVVKLHTMVRKSDGVGVEQFRRYMQNELASGFVASPSLLKLRLHLFEAVDNSRPDAAGVSHFEPPEKQYQAAVELAFKNRLGLEQFFRSPEYARAVRDLATHVKQLSPFPERDAYTFVYNGKLTLAGQRGSTTAERIVSVGATNQLQDDVLDLMLGAGVR